MLSYNVGGAGHCLLCTFDHHILIDNMLLLGMPVLFPHHIEAASRTNLLHQGYLIKQLVRVIAHVAPRPSTLPHLDRTAVRLHHLGRQLWGPRIQSSNCMSSRRLC
jgi:hypothetical protein